ncbi:MAG: hypothetical protein PHX27_01130 [Candidatus ainarchaeum sp.]|nr:hypothetical protein [Candidatus ainarchaeum sp.]
MKYKAIVLFGILLIGFVFANSSQAKLLMTQELAIASLIALVYAGLLVLAFIQLKQKKVNQNIKILVK